MPLKTLRTVLLLAVVSLVPVNAPSLTPWNNWNYERWPEPSIQYTNEDLHIVISCNSTGYAMSIKHFKIIPTPIVLNQITAELSGKYKKFEEPWYVTEKDNSTYTTTNDASSFITLLETNGDSPIFLSLGRRPVSFIYTNYGYIAKKALDAQCGRAIPPPAAE